MNVSSASQADALGGTAAGNGHSHAQFVFICAVDLDRAREALFEVERVTPRLAADQVARFESAREREDGRAADRWRAAHIALRLVLERAAGSEVRGVPYAIADGGRPYLVNSSAFAPPHFNISHSDATALIALSFASPIGIDVEHPRVIRMVDARRRRIEAAAQALAPDQGLPVESDARFLQAWVRLEAAAKATGEGIGRVLTQAGAVGGSVPNLASSAVMQLAIRDLELGPDTFAAVAARALPTKLSVQALPNSVAGLAAFVVSK